MTTEPFEELPLPFKELPAVGLSSYRVYKDAQDFIIVDAPSVIEAVKASGIEPIYKIERHMVDFNKVFKPNDWNEKAAPVEAAALDPAAASPVEAPAAPVAPAVPPA